MDSKLKAEPHKPSPAGNRCRTPKAGLWPFSTLHQPCLDACDSHWERIPTCLTCLSMADSDQAARVASTTLVKSVHSRCPHQLCSRMLPWDTRGEVLLSVTCSEVDTDKTVMVSLRWQPEERMH